MDEVPDESTFSRAFGIKVSDEKLAAVNLKRADFHGDWNYAILPTRKKT